MSDRLESRASWTDQLQMDHSQHSQEAPQGEQTQIGSHQQINKDGQACSEIDLGLHNMAGSYMNLVTVGSPPSQTDISHILRNKRIHKKIAQDPLDTKKIKEEEDGGDKKE